VKVLTPQKLASEGQAAYQKGDYSKAVLDFAAAEQAYRAQGDELQASEMANNRSVALLQAEDHQAALQAVEGTIEIFLGADDQRRLAMALGNRAAALEALGRFDEAMENYEESANIFNRLGEQEMRLEVMRSLSALQLKTGRSLQALASMQAGVDGLEKPSIKQRLLKRILALPYRFIGASKK
jgi:tetratricopeptide (TPR) repeat protein